MVCVLKGPPSDLEFPTTLSRGPNSSLHHKGAYFPLRVIKGTQISKIHHTTYKMYWLKSAIFKTPQSYQCPVTIEINVWKVWAGCTWGTVRNKVMKYGGGAPESPLPTGPQRPRYATVQPWAALPLWAHHPVASLPIEFNSERRDTHPYPNEWEWSYVMPVKTIKSRWKPSPCLQISKNDTSHCAWHSAQSRCIKCYFDSLSFTCWYGTGLNLLPTCSTQMSLPICMHQLSTEFSTIQ